MKIVININYKASLYKIVQQSAFFFAFTLLFLILDYNHLTTNKNTKGIYL